MANGCSDKPVLLGFVDDYTASDKENFYTNKIGGSPDWPGEAEQPSNPPCGVCDQELVLAAQVFAPLSSSAQYHRTLYLFCCLRPCCWNKQKSWICLRSQIPVPQESPQSLDADNNGGPMSATDWLGDADDWGDDGGGGDDWGADLNGNGAMVSVPQTAKTSAKLPDITSININGSTTKKASDDRNGAKADAHRDKAVAEIEMDQEDANICVDLPEVHDAQNIPNLFAVANRDVRSGMKIVPFYMWVEEEQKAEEEAMDHEMRLLNEYKAREAIEAVQGDSRETKKKSQTAGDVYEKSVPSHGDEYFHKFLSVIGQNPGQILRYDRMAGQGPLLLRPLRDSDREACLRGCEYCGGKLTFELQLLPSLVSQMSVKGLEGAPVEFGTVLVFTCHNSCWSDSDPRPKREAVILQQEVM